MWCARCLHNNKEIPLIAKVARLLPQCCPLCWYRETASSTPSIRCCPVSATLYSRTTRTCRRTPPSRNPSLKPTQCPPLSRTRRGTASRTHRAAAATQPFRIRHPARIPAARSRCQVSLNRGFFYRRSSQSYTSVFLFDIPPSGKQRPPLLPTCPQRSR